MRTGAIDAPKTLYGDQKKPDKSGLFIMKRYFFFGMYRSVMVPS
jgi:hypothetical protein